MLSTNQLQIQIDRVARSPTSLEYSHFKELTLEGERGTAVLDAEIIQAQAILDEPQRRRTALREKTDSYKACLSPVRRLPPELIAEIFQFTLKPLNIPTATESPLLLCQICSRWRDIAISLSSLWSNIYLNLYGHPATKVLPLLRLWLDRAKTSPIRMRILSNRDIVDAEALVAALIPYLGTFRDLDLDVPNQLCHDFFEAVPYYFPSSQGQHPYLTVTDPALDRSLFDIPFQNLKILEIATPWSSDLHTILQKCPYLESLTLGRYSSYTDGNPVIPHTITLPNLNILDVTFGNEVAPSTLLNRFILPSLTHLFMFYGDHNRWPHSEFTALLVRSHIKQKLRHLSLGYMQFAPGELEAVFRDSSRIRTLDLSTCLGLGDHFTKMLTVFNDDPSPFLPELERIYTSEVSGYSLESLVEMVESRWWSDPKVDKRNGISRLKMLDLYIEGVTMDPILLERLRHLEKEGMRMPRLHRFFWIPGWSGDN